MAVDKKYKKKKKKNSNKSKKKYSNTKNNSKKKTVKKNNVNKKRTKSNSNNKKKNSSNKSVTKKKKLENKIVEDNIKKEETVVETIVNSNGSNNLDKSEKKKFVRNIILVMLFLCIGLALVICFPKIKLYGDSYVSIGYNEDYVEPGYNASIYNKDITDDVYVEDNIVDGMIGEYEINYYVDLFGSRLKKTRYLNIVDEVAPVINIEKDKISVCPNQKDIKINYSVIDEYDGDITTLTEEIRTDDKIILNASDSSLNSVSKTIMINREDKEKPVIKLKGMEVMFVDYGIKYSEPGYEVSDNCSNNLNEKVKVSGSVGSENGTYIITYEVSDDSGNVSKVTRRVIVGRKDLNQGVIHNGVIYLTFDDGPNEGTTNNILDILKEEGVKATFFVTCKGPDNLIKRIHDEGHVVALHTATHDYKYIYSSINNYYADLKKVSDRVKRITGVDSKIIRFPGGSSNAVSRNYKVGIMTELTNLVLNDGYRYFDWNVDSMDASTSKSGSDVYYNVVSGLSMNRSNVVLMHDTKSITVNGLRNIIKFGKENGYKFSGIDMNTYMVRHKVIN